MAEKPIIFSGPMVRAILAGRKSATRRILKKPAALDALAVFGPSMLMRPGCADLLPFAVGDRLWVREAFSYSWVVRDDPDRRHLMPVWYWADGNPEGGSWSRPKPSIHMPRWASRITLEVTDVRAQRLQDISGDDAQAEGCIHHHDPAGDGQNVIEQFSYLWTSIHGPGAWEANPWVAAITFERVK